MKDKRIVPSVWILPLYSDDTIYKTMYLEREKSLLVFLVLKELLAHLLWFTLSCGYVGSCDPLGWYLVLTLLLVCTFDYDDSYLMGFWYTNLSSFYLLVGPFTLWLYYKIIKCLLYGFINKDLWTIYLSYGFIFELWTILGPFLYYPKFYSFYFIKPLDH